MKNDPRLRQYPTRCRHCGILFFNDPRNAGRTDIRCAFGCRQAQKKESSNKRSKEYYQTDEGKEKKKELNRRRGESKESPPEETKRNLEAASEEPIDQDLLTHLRLVARHIEGRRIALETIRAMANALMRQHRMDFQKKRGYRRSNFAKTPP